MTKNKLQIRMQYISQIKKEMLLHIHYRQYKIKEQLLEKIAIKNQQLLNCGTPTFFYNGNFYGSAISLKKGVQTNKQLHPSLIKQVETTINSDFDTTKTKIHISFVIDTILNNAKHIDDLKQLLPKTLSSKIKEININIFNTDVPLSEDKIEIIKNKIKESISYINNLFLINLLLI